MKSLAIGNYRVSFGYGLVINTGGFSFGKSGSLGTMNRFGRGIAKYTSMDENNYLQGIAATYKLKNVGHCLLFTHFVKRMHG